jgi:hypothetical protein
MQKMRVAPRTFQLTLFPAMAAQADLLVLYNSFSTVIGRSRILFPVA